MHHWRLSPNKDRPQTQILLLMPLPSLKDKRKRKDGWVLAAVVRVALQPQTIWIRMGTARQNLASSIYHPIYVASTARVPLKPSTSLASTRKRLWPINLIFVANLTCRASKIWRTRQSWASTRIIRISSGFNGHVTSQRLQTRQKKPAFAIKSLTWRSKTCRLRPKESAKIVLRRKFKESITDWIRKLVKGTRMARQTKVKPLHQKKE